jgi:hypothetical protein
MPFITVNMVVDDVLVVMGVVGMIVRFRAVGMLMVVWCAVLVLIHVLTSLSCRLLGSEPLLRRPTSPDVT